MNSAPIANLAKRSVGAMIFCLFGYLWMMAWSAQVFASDWLADSAITLAFAPLLAVAIRSYLRNKAALKPPEGQTQTQAQIKQNKKAARLFYAINAGQGVAMFVSANILINLGMSQWVMTAVIFILGLHFIPLARLLRCPPHYVVGTVLMVWAILFPFSTGTKPGNPVSCLGTGLILWLTALYGLTRKTTPHQIEQFASHNG